MRNNDASGRDGERFWEQQKEQTLSHAVQVLRLGLGKASAPDIQRFITTAAISPAQLSDDGWKQGFHSKTFDAAFRANKTAIDAFDLDTAADFLAAAPGRITTPRRDQTSSPKHWE